LTVGPTTGPLAVTQEMPAGPVPRNKTGADGRTDGRTDSVPWRGNEGAPEHVLNEPQNNDKLHSVQQHVWFQKINVHARTYLATERTHRKKKKPPTTNVHVIFLFCGRDNT
jgi:hypothetical protein